MKVVALHTDFRIYWPARLKALSEELAARGDTLEVIEIAGEGSHYSFAGNNDTLGMTWHILFPESKPEELSGETIEPVLFELLTLIKPDVILAGAIAWMNTGRFWGFSDDEMFFGVDVVDNDFWSKSRKTSHNAWGDYFVAVGRQIPKKNYFEVVVAYNKYLKTIGENNPYNLVLIGDGPERGRIEQYVIESGLSDRVILLPFLRQEELPVVYQNAKALICNSNSSETWGLVINEAMAGGCPVFASYECGASNVLVKEDINGYKFKCNDVEMLAECMVRYHNLNPHMQLAMRDSSRNIIEKWGLPRFANGAIEAMNYVMSHPKRRTGLIDKLIINKWHGQYRPI
ncbi:MAG: glycosyltransferase [Muribaculaceae bacterium]|nr:glycosyltransferase [Muribaculaceae bacterium]